MLALCVCKILCEGLSDALRVVVRYVLLLCDMLRCHELILWERTLPKVRRHELPEHLLRVRCVHVRGDAVHRRDLLRVGGWGLNV